MTIFLSSDLVSRMQVADGPPARMSLRSALELALLQGTTKPISHCALPFACRLRNKEDFQAHVDDGRSEHQDAGADAARCGGAAPARGARTRPVLLLDCYRNYENRDIPGHPGLDPVTSG